MQLTDAVSATSEAVGDLARVSFEHHDATVIRNELRRM